jgi:hypothetical protein
MMSLEGCGRKWLWPILRYLLKKFPFEMFPHLRYSKYFIPKLSPEN